MSPPLRRFLFHLHRWSGISVGLVLVVLGLTGSLLVFAEPLDRALDPEHRRVSPAKARVEPSVLLASAQAAASGRAVRLLRFHEHPEASAEAWLEGAGGEVVHLDPYSGRVLGVRAVSAGFVGFVRTLHLTLFAGERGHTAVGLFGIALMVLASTGLLLWWPGHRKLRVGLTLRHPLRWRRGNFDVHKLVGFFSAPLLLLSALTGTALVFPMPFQGALVRLTGAERDERKPVLAAHGPALSLDLLVARARAALPAAQVTRIDLPAKPGTALRIRLRGASELHPNGMSFVHVDPTSGTVLRVDDALAAPLWARVMALRFPVHTGDVGGWPFRLLVLLVGLTPGALFVTGLFLFLARVRAAVPDAPTQQGVTQ